MGYDTQRTEPRTSLTLAGALGSGQLDSSRPGCGCSGPLKERQTLPSSSAVALARTGGKEQRARTCETLLW
jgi:hypothetical protein